MSLGLYNLIQELDKICEEKNLIQGNYHRFNYMEIKIFTEEPNKLSENYVIYGKSISNETKDLKKLYKHVIEKIKDISK